MDYFFRGSNDAASSHGSRLGDAISRAQMRSEVLQVLFPWHWKVGCRVFCLEAWRLEVNRLPTMMIVSHSNFICFPPNRAIHHDALLSLNEFLIASPTRLSPKVVSCVHTTVLNYRSQLYIRSDEVKHGQWWWWLRWDASFGHAWDSSQFVPIPTLSSGEFFSIYGKLRLRPVSSSAPAPRWFRIKSPVKLRMYDRLHRKLISRKQSLGNYR